MNDPKLHAAIIREAAKFIDDLPDHLKMQHGLRFPMLDELEGIAIMMTEKKVIREKPGYTVLDAMSREGSHASVGRKIN